MDRDKQFKIDFIKLLEDCSNDNKNTIDIALYPHDPNESPINHIRCGKDIYTLYKPTNKLSNKSINKLENKESLFDYIIKNYTHCIVYIPYHLQKSRKYIIPRYGTYLDMINTCMINITS